VLQLLQLHLFLFQRSCLGLLQFGCFCCFSSLQGMRHIRCSFKKPSATAKEDHPALSKGDLYLQAEVTLLL